MRGTRDRGEGVVGYVILVPVALFVVLLAVQAAVYFHEANIADNAAGRAAATASRRGSGSGAGRAEARAVVMESGSRLVDIKVIDGALVRATVRLAVSRVVPLFPDSVERSATAPKERFVPEDER